MEYSRNVLFGLGGGGVYYYYTKQQFEKNDVSGFMTGIGSTLQTPLIAVIYGAVVAYLLGQGLFEGAITAGSFFGGFIGGAQIMGKMVET